MNEARTEVRCFNRLAADSRALCPEPERQRQRQRGVNGGMPWLCLPCGRPDSWQVDHAQYRGNRQPDFRIQSHEATRRCGHRPEPVPSQEYRPTGRGEESANYIVRLESQVSGLGERIERPS